MRAAIGLVAVALTLSAFDCGGGSYEGPSVQPEPSAGNTADGAPPDATADNVPTIFCPVIERRVSKDDCDDLAAVEEEVKQGAGAFNAPDPMTRGKAVPVVLVIDRRPPEEVSAIDAAASEDNAADVENNVSANVTGEPVENATGNETAANETEPVRRTRRADRPKAGGPTPSQRVEPYEGRTETIIPKVGRYMSADLVGDGFEIKAMTARSQEVPPLEQATWEWSVTPKVKGPHFLTLKTVVEGEVEGRRYPLARTETTKRVTVRVGPGDRLADFFDGAIAWLNRMKLLLLAIAGVVGALWLLKAKIGGKKDPKE